MTSKENDGVKNSLNNQTNPNVIPTTNTYFSISSEYTTRLHKSQTYMRQKNEKKFSQNMKETSLIYIPKKPKTNFQTIKKITLTSQNQSNSSVSRPLNPSSIVGNAVKSSLKYKKVCRICYEPKRDDDPLLMPCLCEGSMKYVHRSCIKKWIENSKVILDNPKCEVCKTQFAIQKKKNIVLNKEKCRKFVIDILIFFFGIIIIGGGLGYGIYVLLRKKEIILKEKAWVYFAVTGTALFGFTFLCIGIFCKKRINKLYIEEKPEFEIYNYYCDSGNPSDSVSSENQSETKQHNIPIVNNYVNN